MTGEGRESGARGPDQACRPGVAIAWIRPLRQARPATTGDGPPRRKPATVSARGLQLNRQ